MHYDQTLPPPNTCAERAFCGSPLCGDVYFDYFRMSSRENRSYPGVLRRDALRIVSEHITSWGRPTLPQAEHLPVHLAQQSVEILA